MKVQIIRQRRKTIKAAFKSLDVLEVWAPLTMSELEIQAFLKQHQKRLATLYAKYEHRIKQQEEQAFYYLGKKYKVVPIKSSKNKVYFKEDVVYVEYQQEAEDVLTTFLMKETKRILVAELEAALPLFPTLARPSLVIRQMKTRWGTCAYHKGKITLNACLIHVPSICIRYVVLHELLHFTYPNHQQAFHEHLEKLCPAHREIEKLLHQYEFLLGGKS